MIVGLEGCIVKKEPMALHLNVGGVVYEVHISLNCYSEIKTESINLHITQIIREDANLLFGFLNISEKRMFDSLIKITGVGGKVAMAVCSTFSPKTFASIVESQDISSLKRVPGIGPKGAGRIMVELGGFTADEATPANMSQVEAMQALESLGFKKEEIAKALKECSATATGELVKEALKRLNRF